MLLGHPGKLAKLALGQWDTHWSRSQGAVPSVGQLHREVLHRPAADSPTVEGIFAALEPAERTLLAERLAGDIRRAAEQRLRGRVAVAVFLVDMAGQCLGTAGDLTPWR